MFLLQDAVRKMDWRACESTPLHVAAETGATASLEVLLSSGCFPHNTLNAHGATGEELSVAIDLWPGKIEREVCCLVRHL